MIIAKQAKQASAQLLAISEDVRNQALRNIANELRNQSAEILAENIKDVEQAKNDGLTDAMIDRLSLNPDAILSMAESVESIAEQAQVVNTIVNEIVRDDGLILQEQSIPMGVWR